jgi:hypothetical protein
LLIANRAYDYGHSRWARAGLALAIIDRDDSGGQFDALSEACQTRLWRPGIHSQGLASYLLANLYERNL